MKNYIKKYFQLAFLITLISCVDNSFDELPLDDNFPFQLLLDADEGSDLPDAEDYGIAVVFADYLPDLDLPNTTIILSYAITDLTDDMVGSVVVDKVIYEVEIDDCVYERELDFTASGNGLTGTITITPDADLGTVPEEFEIIVTLPGTEDASGSFVFELTGIESSANLLLGSPNVFEYEVLENDLAGEWELEISSEEEFDSFKELFGIINPDILDLSFSDITGKIKAEFEFEEMKFEIELIETEEVTSCEDGETETEVENRIIEFEAEYEAEDGELTFEGSREIFNDNGLVENELDFILEGTYEVDQIEESVTFSFRKLIDEDNFKAGEELFKSETGKSFTFKKD